MKMAKNLQQHIPSEAIPKVPGIILSSMDIGWWWWRQGGGAKVMLATAASGKALSSIIGGQTVNGKLIVIGASDVSFVVPPVLFLSKRKSL